MLKYVDVSALRSLMQGLTFDVENCAGVLDHALVGLNARNGFPDRMCDWVRAGGLAAGPGPFVSQKRTIIRLTETLNQAGQSTYMALVLSAREAESAPLVSLVMHSPTLDVPMVVQLPLRAVLKGSPSLEGAYTVYLHTLLTDRGEAWLYYGITRRGWSLRFHEHTRAAVARKSKRLLARTLDELIDARVAELSGRPDERPRLAGIVTSLCSTGLTEEAALETEEYLVAKYSLASLHPYGLNMIPGGRAGIGLARRESTPSS
ncbi:hypothetical protein [Brevundimonas sp. Bb-A]|jgi:hypothetical protein|uniref:hypothetical protein n=1 Tax=Brevundimonas sp. Bb-A TaxID=2560058 RepID=UPI00128FB843|nr:hypothetical protein [Brevundimonas sp. Bb-A]QFU32338.1 hypothetical protein BSP_11770 [Brevundimonas sp. Bb-A]